MSGMSCSAESYGFFKDSQAYSQCQGSVKGSGTVRILYLIYILQKIPNFVYPRRRMVGMRAGSGKMTDCLWT